MATVILKTSLSGLRGSYRRGAAYVCEDGEAKALVNAGLAEWPRLDEMAAAAKAAVEHIETAAAPAAPELAAKRGPGRPRRAP